MMPKGQRITFKEQWCKDKGKGEVAPVPK